MVFDSRNPHKATLRRILRSSLASKKTADELLDIIVEMQSQMNALLAKMDLDTGITDTDYSDLAVDVVDPDA